MPNLILNEKVLPEYIQNEVTATNLANQIIYWLQNPAELDKIRHNLARLEDKLGPPGATQRAGDIILNGLNL
jgi:lipid-A-disaccharide synthase